MSRVLLTVQYLGTRYSGWQTQKNGVGVQQVIESALARLFGAEIRIEGAGRTDSGVHAIGQRAHFDLPLEIGPRGVLLGLNAKLPHDIRITDVVPVPDGFHARFNATGKTYRYHIWNGEAADVFHRATHAWVAEHLDDRAMAEASRPLVGTHDFRSFTVAAPTVSSTCRTIEALTVRRENKRIEIEVGANGFLRLMVRRIAGSLIEVGRGRLDAAELEKALEPHFATARWTAAAQGLTLLEVRYSSVPNRAEPGPDPSVQL